MKNKLILLFFSVFFIEMNAQHTNQMIRKGNNSYKDTTYDRAEEFYRKALEKDQSSNKGKFNLADALYKQERYEESASLFKALSEESDDSEIKSKSFYNLGNSLFKSEKYDESIEAYKNSLKINPDDDDCRHNLALAQKTKQQSEQEQNKEEKEEEQKKEEEKEQEEESNEKENNEKQENSQDKQGENKEPEKPQDPNEMTKKEAEQMLDALQQQEKKLQEELQKKKGKKVKSTILKDW